MTQLTALDVFGKEHYTSKDNLTWRPGVYGIVIKDDKILLSPQFDTKFDLPGGGVELGEDFTAAVIREVKEETGIDVVVKSFVGMHENLFASVHGDKKFYHSIMLFYTCEAVGGELSTTGFDPYEVEYAELAQWFPISELDSIEVASTFDYRPLVRKTVLTTGGRV